MSEAATEKGALQKNLEIKQTELEELKQENLKLEQQLEEARQNLSKIKNDIKKFFNNMRGKTKAEVLTLLKQYKSALDTFPTALPVGAIRIGIDKGIWANKTVIKTVQEIDACIKVLEKEVYSVRAKLAQYLAEHISESSKSSDSWSEIVKKDLKKGSALEKLNVFGSDFNWSEKSGLMGDLSKYFRALKGYQEQRIRTTEEIKSIIVSNSVGDKPRSGSEFLQEELEKYFKSHMKVFIESVF